MVDYEPYLGDFTGTVVTNNTIMGGFATESPVAGETAGSDSNNAIIK